MFIDLQNILWICQCKIMVKVAYVSFLKIYKCRDFPYTSIDLLPPLFWKPKSKFIRKSRVFFPNSCVLISEYGNSLPLGGISNAGDTSTHWYSSLIQLVMLPELKSKLTPRSMMRLPSLRYFKAYSLFSICVIAFSADLLSLNSIT